MSTSCVKSTVRWGGRVVKVDKLGDELVVEILNHPLDQKGKPIQSSAANGGRFIARLQPPYKQIRYYRGRWVTVAGEISGSEVHTLASGQEQRLPVVNAVEHHAWREEYRHDYDYYDPWWPGFYFDYGHYGKKYNKSRTGFGIIFNPRFHKSLPK